MLHSLSCSRQTMTEGNCCTRQTSILPWNIPELSIFPAILERFIIVYFRCKVIFYYYYLIIILKKKNQIIAKKMIFKIFFDFRNQNHAQLCPSPTTTTPWSVSYRWSISLLLRRIYIITRHKDSYCAMLRGQACMPELTGPGSGSPCAAGLHYSIPAWR